MQCIGVDPYGIKIMLPKAMHYVIKVGSLQCIAANILKQEMLSLGGDVALARGALTGKIKNTDCLILGNLSQYSRLNEKLKKQPFGLGKIAFELSRALNNYQKNEFLFNLGGHKIKIMPGLAYIMGIVNLTPDSFSGDGFYSSSCVPVSPAGGHHPCLSGRQASSLPLRQAGIERIVEVVNAMIKDGADIIDVGGESSRPNAAPISVKEELGRVIPVIRALAKKVSAPISVDTYKPEVARQALDNGATIINDITALGSGAQMIKIAKKYKAAVVLMHMKGNPKTMQRNPKYVSLLDDIIEYLGRAVNRALEGGINEDSIIIDPGIGFGKTMGHNLGIIKNLEELKVLGRPILVGASRKSFIGKILNADPLERLPGTIASCVLAVKNGANFLRVHDVKEIRQALKLADAVINA